MAKAHYVLESRPRMSERPIESPVKFTSLLQPQTPILGSSSKDICTADLMNSYYHFASQQLFSTTPQKPGFCCVFQSILGVFKSTCDDRIQPAFNGFHAKFRVRCRAFSELLKRSKTRDKPMDHILLETTGVWGCFAVKSHAFP